MTIKETVELTLDGVLSLLQKELDRAAQALQMAEFDRALDSYVGALGLALQLGPAATERVLHAILGTGRELARQGEASVISAMGPALVDLVEQVRGAGVLPATPVMEAWATVTADLGALVGQIGLALTMPPRHRSGMLDSASTRAALLDDVTGSLFSLTAWLLELQSVS
jgi:hypothetical protein